MPRPSATNEFVSYVKDELKQRGFRLCFGRGKMVNGGDAWRAAGYFDDKNKILRIAKGRADWLDVMIHEYAHFLQWVEQPANVYNADARASLIVANFLHHKKQINPTVLKRAFARVMAFERDAERRAVFIAAHWELPVDPQEYARQANIYIYSHHLMRDTGKWKPIGNPYRATTIKRLMPSNFRNLAHQAIPKNVYRALARFYK